MNKWLERCERVIRVGLGGLFVLAGVLKLESPQAFADSIYAYRLLPDIVISPIALGLPVFEIAIGLGLVAGWRQRLFSGVTAGMMLVFTLALLQAQLRHLEVDCACFGSATALEKLVPPLLRDVLLLAAAIFLYRQARAREGRQAQDRQISGAPPA